MRYICYHKSYIQGRRVRCGSVAQGFVLTRRLWVGSPLEEMNYYFFKISFCFWQQFQKHSVERISIRNASNQLAESGERKVNIRFPLHVLCCMRDTA